MSQSGAIVLCDKVDPALTGYSALRSAIREYPKDIAIIAYHEPDRSWDAMLAEDEDYSRLTQCDMISGQAAKEFIEKERVKQYGHISVSFGSNQFTETLNEFIERHLGPKIGGNFYCCDLVIGVRMHDVFGVVDMTCKPVLLGRFPLSVALSGYGTANDIYEFKASVSKCAVISQVRIAFGLSVGCLMDVVWDVM